MSEIKTDSNLQSKIITYFSSRNTLKNVAGLALGAVAGFIYYRTTGCSSGGCAITSNPYMTILWGGLLGYLLADMFKIKEKTSESGKEDETKS